MRSVSLDNWTSEQVKYFEFGGNANAASFYGKYNLLDKPPAYKYKTIAAQAYRDYVG